MTSHTTLAGRALLQFAADVRAGLTQQGQKELPSKYLYDEVGSALFEVITVLPEYGLTRAGERLLQRHARELVERLPLPVAIAELGSGSGKNTRLILEALARRQPATAYYPIDLSAAAIANCKRELHHIDSVRVAGLERPFLEGLTEAAGLRRQGEGLLVLFLGSNIGNFDRAGAEGFLRQVRRTLLPGDRLLVGADLEKPIPALLAAYDDPIGVTAAFNLNLLSRINRELGANFDLSRFQHVALYNEKERRVEMHLRSTIDQTVAIPGAEITAAFRQGETIWTESSHRYRREEIAETARASGFFCEAQWVDEEWPFAHSLFVADPDSRVTQG
jgi:dimethylhistidine N-methyltransferase